MSAFLGNGRMAGDGLGGGSSGGFMQDAYASQQNQSAFQGSGRIQGIATLVGRINAYASMSGASARTEGGAFNSDSYSTSGKDYFSGILPNELETPTSGLQIQNEIIAKASYVCSRISEFISLRSNTHFYKIVEKCLHDFKKPFSNSKEEDPIFTAFANEVSNNMQLFRWITQYACLGLTYDFAQYELNGRGAELNQNQNVQLNLIWENFRNIMLLQFIDWLIHQPNVRMLLEKLTNEAKVVLNNTDENMESMRAKFLFLTSGTDDTIPFPWKKGLLDKLKEKTQSGSSILMNIGTREMIDNYESTYHFNNEAPLNEFHSGGHVNDAISLIKRMAREARGEPSVQNTHPNWYGSSVETLSGYTPELKLSNITRENRLDYKFLDYFTPIGDTHYYLCDPNDFIHFAKVLDCKKPMGFRPEFIAWPGDFIIFKVDWANGVYDYDLIMTNESLTMSIVLSDPDKLLPYMNVDPENSGKISYEMYVENQKNIVDNKGRPTSIPDCVTLEKQPNILIGNKPLELDNSSKVFNTLFSVSNSYDPKKTLDAMIIPIDMHTYYQLEDDVDLEDFQEVMACMVKGSRHGLLTTSDVIKSIRSGLTRISSEELTGAIKDHITNTINRWLIERRFYSETKEGNKFVRVQDGINDFLELCHYLEENDRESLKDLLDYGNNDFLRENFEIIANHEETLKYKNNELSKIDDPSIKFARENAFKTGIVFKRQLIVADLRKMNYIPNLNMVVSKRSSRPDFQAIYDECIKVAQKHFKKEYLPVLMTFNKDPNFNVWSVTPSGYDSNMLTLRSISRRKELTMFDMLVTK